MVWSSGSGRTRLRFGYPAALLVLLPLLLPLRESEGPDPRIAYDHALQLFLHGYLATSQQEAGAGYRRLAASDPEWAVKFRLLEARNLSMRGKFEEAESIFESLPANPASASEAIQKLTLEGMNLTGSGKLPEAATKLAGAAELCRHALDSQCGVQMVARGVLAVYLDQPQEGRKLLLEGLDFARAHRDPWLEATALLNLGWAAIQNERFADAQDWLGMALETAGKAGLEDRRARASGNLGWAYFELGDAELALQLFHEAETHAVQLGDFHAQLNWLATTGYVLMNEAKTGEAREYYREALRLAQANKNQGDIAGIITDLAQVEVLSANPAKAEVYVRRALAHAQQSESWQDMLDCFAIEMQIAALRGDTPRARHLLRRVVSDPESQSSMKWTSQDAMARLYESQGKVQQAERQYRAALATYEAARGGIQHDGSQVPFAANATRIYDHYIHFLLSRGLTEQALVAADQSRARTLAQGLSEAGNATAPLAAISPRAVSKQAGATLLFYWLGEKQSYLWAVTPERVALFPLPDRERIAARLERYRRSLLDLEDPPGVDNDDGRALYAMLVAPAAKLIGAGKPVMILSDGALSKLNFETLIAPARRAKPGWHYWIEDATPIAAPSMTMLAAARPVPGSRGRLLLLGDALPSREYPELRWAQQEMARIEAHFPARDAVVLTRERAQPEAYAASDPRQFAYIHFVTHGFASTADPLDSAIVLSPPGRSALASNHRNGGEDSYKLYAREIMRHPIQARLVTISACNGSGARSFAGEGLVGLSWAFLRAGAHNAIGALWEASDESTPQLMDALYAGLERGEAPAQALREAKLELLHSKGKFRSPFYWAPFQLYTRR